MFLKNVELKVFKFHYDLSFELKKKNCLVYGENGSGKSSIYEALYTSLYDLKIIGEEIDLEKKYKHRDYPIEPMEINIAFNNGDRLIRKGNNPLENRTLLENQTIYCTNERLLREITEQDFYKIINTRLVEHFPALKALSKVYSLLSRDIKRYNRTGIEAEGKIAIVEKRVSADKAFQAQFEQLIPVDKINYILTKRLDEDFEIEFKVIDSSIDFSVTKLKFISPKIQIKVKHVDDRGDFQSHFNEAKIKLISLAVYFALAKHNEQDSHLKILVLDDFLTSLDMANRKLIIQFILDDFSDYQKIIFTHNIQFYNLIIKLLAMRGEHEDWDIKNMFLSNKNGKEIANIYSLHSSYLKRAEDKLDAGELESAGNFLRKEFERIVHEFEQILSLGGKESLNNIINSLKDNEQYFYENPHKKLQKLSATIHRILSNAQQPNNAKITQIERCIAKLEKNKISFNSQSNHYNILEKTEFYKNILMNPSSHDDSDIEIYSKECKSTIKLLKELDKILNHLKPSGLRK